ncbi:DUF4280 domain-containing protein [Nakamurella lactea]|uniref:DUF4280 domain-containing protein n=1 Tax=Nakamurella lactea TaxID=459515 RepID=UPI0004295DF7|nr:DUF4280 domain-containing protein [Nakamurella lactea]
MGQCVVSGAALMCTMGMAPSSLVVVNPTRPIVEGRPAAAITDIAPMANIPPFGMCQSLANPTVAAATAAALGVLTPMPCVPVPAAPWAPGGPTVLVGGLPVVTQTSKCMCAYGGVISVTLPGAATVTTP